MLRTKAQLRPYAVDLVINNCPGKLHMATIAATTICLFSSQCYMTLYVGVCIVTTSPFWDHMYG